MSQKIISQKLVFRNFDSINIRFFFSKKEAIKDFMRCKFYTISIFNIKYNSMKFIDDHRFKLNDIFKMTHGIRMKKRLSYCT